MFYVQFAYYTYIKMFVIHSYVHIYILYVHICIHYFVTHVNVHRTYLRMYTFSLCYFEAYLNVHYSCRLSRMCRNSWNRQPKRPMVPVMAQLVVSLDLLTQGYVGLGLGSTRCHF